MIHLLRSLKSFQLLSALLVVNFIAVSLQFRTGSGETVLKSVCAGIFLPVASAAGGGMAALGDWLSAFRTVRELKDENLALRRELAAARIQQTLLEEQIERSASLERMVRVLPEFGRDAVLAEVTMRSFQVWDRDLTIRGGYREGIVPDLPVLETRGVVGRILVAGPTHSQVALVTNAGFALSGIIRDRGIRGIIHGSGRYHLKFDYVHIAAPVQPGDWIHSSGDDGIFPPGLVVGRVLEVDRSGQYFQEIKVQPAVDMSRCRYVFVLKRTAGVEP
jgi:rod shape-determining protein MreC